MFKSRVGPAVLSTSLIGGFLYYQTGSGKVQPTGHAKSQQPQLSEALQGATGQGGAAATDQPDKGEWQHRTNTRIVSNQPDAPAKRNPAKSRDEDRESLGPIHPLQSGKHIGERDLDIPQKKEH